MLLRRIAVALRRQDWLAVFIEFILVIAGILIALEINNWNEDQKTLREEKQILQRLEKDLLTDQATISETQEFYRSHLENLTKQSEFLYQSEQSKQDIKDFRYGGAHIQEINPRTTTYDEIVNSGRLYKFSDQMLVDKIIDYYRLIEYQTYQNRQTRNEYRNIAYGPALTDYWFWVAHPEREKYAIEFFSNKDTTAYKSLIQTAAWGVEIIESRIKANKELLTLNRDIIELIQS